MSTYTYHQAITKLNELGYKIFIILEKGKITGLEIEDYTISAEDVPLKIKSILRENFKAYYLKNIGRIIIEKK